MNILVINSGSSSLKYQLFQMPAKDPVCSGLVERIGIVGSFIKHTVYTAGGKVSQEKDSFIANHGDGLNSVIELMSEGDNAVISSVDDITAVGHRIVHGGEFFSKATLITKEVKQQIKDLSPLAPLHNPVAYKCIEVAELTFPNAKQIAVFDTAFHQTLPEEAYRYALPEKYYKEHAVRVYGFHGTSHKYVSEQAAEWLNKPDAKIISIHLGNGCSMTAIKNGKSIDTSMGLGPLSGLMMGTRSGDIDPSVLFYLMEASGYTAAQVKVLLNNQSGLLGVGGSSDMRDIRKLFGEGDAAAKLALGIYCYRIKKFIGAYSAILNGVDAILFTAGVGENDKATRAAVCKEMDYLNIIMDEEKNVAYSGKTMDISTPESKVRILVIPTNEEYEIANQCYHMVETAVAS